MGTNHLITLEYEPPEIYENACSCCKAPVYSKLGDILIDNEFVGQYVGVWTDGKKHNNLQLIVTLGDFEQDETLRQNQTIFLNVRMVEDHSEFMVRNGSEIPFGNKEDFGKLYSRDEALKSPILPRVFQIAECITNDDEDIFEYLKTLLQ